MLAHINSIDHNIQFTSEREVEHVIPFLDVEIMRNVDGSLSTKVYRKPTHTDQYLQFSSHHPMAHKRSVVSTLLKRAASHCSSNSLVRKEKAYVKETLRCNGYPERFLLNATDLGRTQGTRMTLDPTSLSRTFKVFRKQWLGSCQTSMFRST